MKDSVHLRKPDSVVKRVGGTRLKLEKMLSSVRDAEYYERPRK